MEAVLWTGHCGKDMRGSALGIQVPLYKCPKVTSPNTLIPLEAGRWCEMLGFCVWCSFAP